MAARVSARVAASWVAPGIGVQRDRARLHDRDDNVTAARSSVSDASRVQEMGEQEMDRVGDGPAVVQFVELEAMDAVQDRGLVG